MNGIPAYDYDYTYGPGGNLATRINHTPNPDVTRTYVYDTAANHHAHALIRITGDGLDDSFGYDANGNMTGRTLDGLVYTQVFNVENRLESVAVNGQTTYFYYDADGNRTLTIYGTGTNQVKVYTPFPDFEETIPASGTVTQRTSYTLAGQLIAVRVRTGTTGNGTLSYAFDVENVGHGAIRPKARTGNVPKALTLTGTAKKRKPPAGSRSRPVRCSAMGMSAVSSML